MFRGICWVYSAPPSCRSAFIEGVMQNQIRYVVAIASGKGGVGKSTVTVNLAHALAAMGLGIGILDADIYGPSQRRMLGVAEDVMPEQEDGKWLHPIEAQGLKAMSMGFLTDEATATVWRGPMASGALTQMLEQTLWGPLDILLVDMPPGTGDIQLTLAQKAALAGAVVVTTPQDIALIDAKKGIEMFRKVDVPILGIIENMSTHVCSACGHEEPIFGEGGGRAMAGEYAVEVLASLPLSRAVREAADSGMSLATAAPDEAAVKAFASAAEMLWAGLQGADRPAAPVITMGDD